MAESKQRVETVDHVAVAEDSLRCAGAAIEYGEEQDAYFAHRVAQVHAALAIAEQLKRLNKTLGLGLLEDSHLDHIAQATRMIAEPEKYGAGS